MQPLSGENRSQRIKNLQPAHGEHEAGSARLLPRYVRKAIRFAVNFSPVRILHMGKRKRTYVILMALLAGGYIFAGDTNRSQIMASASSLAGFETSKLIVEGNINLDPAEIQHLLRNELGSSMFEFDVVEARKKINSMNWVRESSVRKVFPGTIIVKVEEFEPFALWKMEDAVNLISVEGNVIGRASQRHMLLPQVVGDGANEVAAEVLSAIQAYPELAERSEAFVRVGKRRWNIVMEGGLRVLLPETEWRESLENLRAMQVENRLLDREIIQVDMRLPDRMIMKLKHEDAEVRKTVIREALEKDWHKI